MYQKLGDCHCQQIAEVGQWKEARNKNPITTESQVPLYEPRNTLNIPTCRARAGAHIWSDDKNHAKTRVHSDPNSHAGAKYLHCVEHTYGVNNVGRNWN